MCHLGQFTGFYSKLGPPCTLYLFFLRFVNTVSISSLEKDIIWKHIKTIRTDYLVKSGDLTCKNSFVPRQNISDNFEKISQLIGVKSSEDETRNLSKSVINIGVEMFFALNSCPSFYVRLYWKAIYGPETRIALLASNIIKKVNNDFKSLV